MKNLILISFLFLGSLKVSAQIQDLWISGDSTNFCIETGTYLSFNVGAQEEINPVITVYWGDGTTDVINNGIYPANQYSSFTVNHTYSAPGAYNVYATFLSSVNSQLIQSSTSVFNFLGENMCGSLYPYVYQNMNCGTQGNWYHDAIFDVTDPNGVTSTFAGNMNGLNITTVPYTLSINDNWLQENNLSQATGDITITEFNSYGYPTINLPFEVATLNPTNLPDYFIGYAYAYGLSPLEELRMGVYVYNQTCSTNGSIRVSITFPIELIPNTTGLTNPSINGNVLSYDLIASEYYYYFSWLTFYMPGTTAAGEELNFNVSVSDLASTETVVSNNSLDFTGLVFNSYDPNNKLVNRGQNINPNQQEELIYTINFQNEGNFNAINVKVIDTLSSNLDLSTFHVLNNKHNLVTSINEQTNVVEFKFTEANLAPKEQDEEGSKGFVTYAIKEKANLPINSEIENTAYIYFDFNPAIITNTTYNKNSLLGISENKALDFQIFPNPAKNKLNVESKFENNDVFLLDLSGKMIINQKIGFKGQIDVSSIENGVYYLKIVNNQTNSVQKIVVNK
jgi:uncharacterized repeat protein (TIGR01451 family)